MTSLELVKCVAAANNSLVSLLSCHSHPVDMPSLSCMIWHTIPALPSCPVSTPTEELCDLALRPLNHVSRQFLTGIWVVCCSQPVLEYTCPKCAATYTTLQASALIDFRDGQFHCEHCQTVLITAEASDGTQSSHSARRERLKAMKELQV